MPNDLSSISGQGQYNKSDSFYFEDIFLLVEDTVFKVPRRNFELGSEVFRDMFQLPQSGLGDGSSEDRPLRLEGVKKDDMVQLLRVMFPHHQGHKETLTSEQWLSVLKLSNMWNFAHIWNIAADKLDKSIPDPIDRIMLAREHEELEHWLVPALNQLYRRRLPLSVSEAERLGIVYTVKLWLRENDSVFRPSTSEFFPRQICSAFGLPQIPASSSP